MITKAQEFIDIVQSADPNFEGDHVFGAQMISKINRHGKKDERLLVLTDFNAYLYNVTFFTRQAKISRCFRWDSLTEISSDGSNHFELIFHEGTLSLFDENAVQIAVSVAIHVSNIFPKENLPYFNFNKEYLDEFKLANDAVFKRFEFLCYCAGKPIPSELAKAIKSMEKKNMFVPENQNFKLNLNNFFRFFEYTDFLLKAIEVNPRFQSLEVPQKRGAYWPHIINFFATNRTITRLEVSDTIINQSFKEFVEVITENKYCALTTLCFSNLKFDMASAVNLMIILNSKNISYLLIQNGLTSDGVEILEKYIKAGQNIKSLHTLVLNQSAPFDINVLVQYCPHIQILKLIDCGFDIVDVFLALNNTNSYIKDINLSKNFAKKQVQFQITLPQSLKSLVFNHITVENNALTFLFNSLIQNFGNRAMNLSLSEIQMTPDQWNYFSQYLSQLNLTLSHFVFDNNQFDENIVQFLRQSTISRLSLSGCLFETSPCINSFGNYIASSNSLVELNISGGNNVILGQALNFILQCISRSKTIKIINVSNQKAGPGIYELLLNILQSNQTISVIKLDDNNPTDVQSLKHFLNALIKRNIKMDIEVPFHDLKELQKANLITEDGCNEIMVLSNRIKKLNPKRVGFSIPSNPTPKVSPIVNLDVTPNNNVNKSQSASTFNLQDFSANNNRIGFSSLNGNNAPDYNLNNGKKLSVSTFDVSDFIQDVSPSSGSTSTLQPHQTPKQMGDIGNLGDIGQQMQMGEAEALIKHGNPLEQGIPAEILLLNERTKEEFLYDAQWESIVDNIPEVDMEQNYPLLVQYYQISHLLSVLATTS